MNRTWSHDRLDGQPIKNPNENIDFRLALADRPYKMMLEIYLRNYDYM